MIVAEVNNRIKRKYGEIRRGEEEADRLDQGLYNEVQMNMFKKAISEEDGGE